jgi:DNA polymerase-3 subunit epsilon
MSESSENIARSYRQALSKSWADDCPPEQVRFVSFDAETTSLDPRQAHTVALGGVAIFAGEIQLDDSIELLIRQRYNSSAVTIHGITREESLAGVDARDALARTLEYFGNAVLVGHHVGFDVTLLDTACYREFDVEIHNRTLDTAELALLLAQDGALPEMADFSLDALLRIFGIEPHDRHTAAGDAFLTALAFQRLLRVARHAGRLTLAQLLEKPTVASQQST